MFVGNSIIVNREADAFSKAINSAVDEVSKKYGITDCEVQYEPVVSNGFVLHTAMIVYRKDIALAEKPDTDVAPVVHAHWVDDRDGIDIAFGECDPDCHCSACGNRSNRYFKYCPQCGAKMDQEVNA